MMKTGNRIRIGSKAIGPMEAVITDENPETGNTIWKAVRSEEIRTGGMRIWATLRGLRGRGILANVSFDF